MNSLSTAWQALNAFGLPTLFHYARYQLKLRSGWLRLATAVKEWPQVEGAVVPESPPVGFGQPTLLAEAGAWGDRAKAEAIEAGEAVLAGRFPAFGAFELQLGFPPRWDTFLPIAGAERASPPAVGRHWTSYDINEFEADVKLLWELSRFNWVYPLARAFLWSGQTRFAEGFWSLLLSWTEANPPNRGPQWISGQEIAFRLLAMGFGLSAFWPWLAGESARVVELTSWIAAHGARIPPTLDYSRAQGNNHQLSEAVGLLMAAVVCRKMPQAAKWERLGRAELMAGLRDQIFPDGGYAQHSHNYARLALELGSVGALLAARTGGPLTAESLAALRRCARLLAAMVEGDSGQTANFGPNDGSQLLPLTSCRFGDFRPTLQAAAAILGDLPGYSEGPWDELCLSLGRRPAGEGEHAAPPASYPQAGLYRLDGQETRLTLRAADFRSRPGHSDQLQLDLWWRGEALALDPGTYLYAGSPPWDNGLAGADVHNGVTVDGEDPMRRAGRFLWLRWSKAGIREKVVAEAGRLALMVAAHQGYRHRGVQQERTVVRVADRHLLVVDDLLGEGFHTYLLPWLTPDREWSTVAEGLRMMMPGGQVELTVQGTGGEQALYRAGQRLHGPELPTEPARWGWFSPTYGLKQPALHWVTAGEGELPLQIRTWWSLDGADRSELSLEWQEVSGTVPRLVRVAHDGDVLER